MTTMQGSAPVPCDLIIHNAHLLTMDAGRRVYASGAVVIAGSRIVAAGRGTAVATFLSATDGWRLTQVLYTLNP